MTWSHNGVWMTTTDDRGFVKYWQANLNNVHTFQAHNDPVRSSRWDGLPSPCQCYCVVLCIHHDLLITHQRMKCLHHVHVLGCSNDAVIVAVRFDSSGTCNTIRDDSNVMSQKYIQLDTTLSCRHSCIHVHCTLTVSLPLTPNW